MSVFIELCVCVNVCVHHADLFHDSLAVWCRLVLKAHSTRWATVCATSILPLGCRSSQSVIVCVLCVCFILVETQVEVLATEKEEVWNILFVYMPTNHNAIKSRTVEPL